VSLEGIAAVQSFGGVLHPKRLGGDPANRKGQGHLGGAKGNRYGMLSIGTNGLDAERKSLMIAIGHRGFDRGKKKKTTEEEIKQVMCFLVCSTQRDRESSGGLKIPASSGQKTT